MDFGSFACRVEDAGLEARKCSPHHWQVIGNRVVNFWPTSKGGAKLLLDCAPQGCKAQHGSLEDAIKLAGKPVAAAPFDDRPVEAPEQSAEDLCRRVEAVLPIHASNAELAFDRQLSLAVGLYAAEVSKLGNICLALVNRKEPR